MLHPAVFVTTCTPHLGVGKDQSYIPNLPFWMQYIIAKCIGRSGNDLFRIPTVSSSTTTRQNQTQPEQSKHAATTTLSIKSDIIQEMAFRDDFMRPLQNFHRRLALCNTYRTDLQVPCSTAAFLTSPLLSSSSILVSESGNNDTVNHHIHDYYRISEWNDKVRNASNNKSCISLIVETAAIRNATRSIDTHRTSTPSFDQPQRTSNEIAIQLDSLGWIKIFCDTRPYLPYIHIPSSMTNALTMFIQLISTLLQSLKSKILATFTSTATNQDDLMTQKVTLTSTTNHKNTKNSHSTREIWDRYIDDTDTDYQEQQHLDNMHKWYVPFGHTVVIANAKNEWYGRINAAGQPTMDHLAKIIIHEILQSTANKK